MASSLANLPTIPSSSSLRILSSYSPKSTLNFSFYSHLSPSPIAFRSISLKSSITRRPSSSTIIVSAVKKLSETDLVTFPSEAGEFSGKFPSDSGVYGVYDEKNELQFIGISRNIGASVLSHRKSVPELCYSVKGFDPSHLTVSSHTSLAVSLCYINVITSCFYRVSSSSLACPARLHMCSDF